MQKHIRTIFTITLVAFLAACGGGKKDSLATLNDKKTQLEKLKKERTKLDESIKKIQEEIAKIDGGVSAQKPKLVKLETINTGAFEHAIELQGKIDADNISYVAPRGAPGMVRAVYVRQGQMVSRGQLLLKLDNAVQLQQVALAKQSLGSLKTQIALEKSIYQRLKNLWEKGIGKEVDVIAQKAKIDALENQLAAGNQQVRVAQEAANLANVYADVSGVADVVNIRPGETFTGMSAAGPQIKIVNTSNLKVVGNIPENYLANVSKGANVEVSVPDLNKKINTVISFVGASIDPSTRGFVMEAKLPSDPQLKPNQIAVVRIKDYASNAALTVPVNTLQNDENGKFIFVAVNENGKLVAKKRQVNIGLLNGDRLEIKTGLNSGDKVITEGFQGVYEGQVLTLN